MAHSLTGTTHRTGTGTGAGTGVTGTGDGTDAGASGTVPDRERKAEVARRNGRTTPHGVCEATERLADGPMQGRGWSGVAWTTKRGQAAQADE